MAQERSLSELQFDQAATKQTEKYTSETVKKISISYLPSILSFQIRPSTYDFDYEKQYATFLSKQINEYHPFEQTSDYDPEYLPSEQVNIYIYSLFHLNTSSYFEDSSEYI